ncbi:hypothetical protein STRIP9103_02668 [Streptomyces ipomoeae 91-03]|uniref:DUF2330 domain-containing protein n=2 Tax=Streptomyces ipomoeae TaxID=103232 RepID=L1L736_9ACTN|nr:DUF2330 domain-containing protein [Streptomyces ipomoeae]EKX68614.1 hypothetical protein STRIP9103_02668 [Streptomyces ipomoeae 91-03]
MNGFMRGRTHPAEWAHTGRGRLLVVVLALLGFQLASLMAPAYACGCGAMVPDAQRNVYVNRETSVVRWDGREEQIVMRLTVAGDARTAAWIMPVPNRATVELDDSALFDQLTEETAPEYRTREYFWPRSGDWPFDELTGDGAGAAPGDGSVGVVGRERLGPFDVARLTATDSGALGDWLDDNGFELPDRLDAALEPYVQQKWEYVAIRLAPEDSAGDAPLAGALDPLHLTFASEEPVYPMRLSRLATTPQALDLYVLAAHRMEPTSAIGGDEPEVTFAGRVLAVTGPLGELSGGRTDYLTAFEQNFPQPERISGDHTLRRAATDEPYRKVIYVDEMWTVGGIPGWLLSFGIGMGVLAVKAVAVAIVLRRNAKRQLPPASPPGAAFPPPGAPGMPGPYPPGTPGAPGAYPPGAAVPPGAHWPAAPASPMPPVATPPTAPGAVTDGKPGQSPTD